MSDEEMVKAIINATAAVNRTAELVERLIWDNGRVMAAMSRIERRMEKQELGIDSEETGD